MGKLAVVLDLTLMSEVFPALVYPTIATVGILSFFLCFRIWARCVLRFSMASFNRFSRLARSIRCLEK